MSAALRKPAMTRDQFLDWVQTQDARQEFDGFVPVAMVSGSINHSRIAQNIYAALYAKLEGSGCEPLGPDAGVATIGARCATRMRSLPAARYRATHALYRP